MSNYSGKCDLAVHLSFQKMYKVTTEELKKLRELSPEEVYAWSKTYKEPEHWNVGISDELECFEEFKRRTGGVIYQHIKADISEYNQKKIAAYSGNNLIITEHVNRVPDKHKASGVKEIITYTYNYYNKEYASLKALNKHGVYIVKEIHFETLLDLLPYYPYIITMSNSSKDKETVFISSRSYVDREEEELISISGEATMASYYRKELAEHYREIVLRYFNPEVSTEGKLYL